MAPNGLFKKPERKNVDKKSLGWIQLFMAGIC
jgi:hypothetical protein